MVPVPLSIQTTCRLFGGYAEQVHHYSYNLIAKGATVFVYVKLIPVHYIGLLNRLSPFWLSHAVSDPPASEGHIPSVSRD